MVILEYDEMWKALIDHYTSERCIVEGEEFPRHSKYYAECSCC